MKENYALSEIKKELLKEIKELEKVDESWKNCRLCPFKGKCCIDNDIDIREDEWEEIEKFLNENKEIRDEVYQNFINGSKCYFRSERCCLINEIRPTNCLYTPYQAIQLLENNHLIYSRRDENCNFITVEKEYEKLDDKDYIISIPGEENKYLLLNHWFLNYDMKSQDYFKEEAYYRLKRYFDK